MKKSLMAGLVALTLVAAAQQRASAWCKFNFGIGFNTSYQGGNNSVLWGGVNGGPAPGQFGYDGGFGSSPVQAPAWGAPLPATKPATPEAIPAPTPGAAQEGPMLPPAQPVSYSPYGAPPYSFPMYYPGYGR